MKFIVHVHIHNNQSESKLDEILKLLINNNLKLNKLMTKEEFAQALEDVNVIFQKALTEVVNAAQASGNSTPRMDAALNALRNAATAFDELNPDAPAPEPTPEP